MFTGSYVNKQFNIKEDSATFMDPGDAYIQSKSILVFTGHMVTMKCCGGQGWDGKKSLHLGIGFTINL